MNTFLPSALGYIVQLLFSYNDDFVIKVLIKLDKKDKQNKTEFISGINLSIYHPYLLVNNRAFWAFILV